MVPPETALAAFQRWACCGPDYPAWIQSGILEADALVALFSKHGEIRVRYAGLLLHGLNLDETDDVSQPLNLACRDKWLAPATLRYISRVLRDEDPFPAVPWLAAYMPRAGAGATDLVTRAAGMSWSNGNDKRLPISALDSAHGTRAIRHSTVQALLDGNVLVGEYEINPDFCGDSVLCWLSYMRHGADDPILGKPHARYRPDKHHREY